METKILFGENYKTHNSFYPCPYFDDGRLTNLVMVYPTETQQNNYYEFLANGYRRYSNFFYQQVCNGCSECIPMRLEVDKFKLSKSQRRCLRKNSDVRVDILDSPINDKSMINRSMIDSTRLQLFTQYKLRKHNDEKINIFERLNELTNLHQGYNNITEMDYYLGEKLIGVGIVDRSKNCISTNYFYYSMDYPKQRLGVFSLLKEIEYAKSQNLKYHYLGFYIANVQCMSYKNEYKPNQILTKAGWADFLE